MGMSALAEAVKAILVVEGHFAPVAVSRDFVSKHEPKAGGRDVADKDGCQSFSPAHGV